MGGAELSQAFFNVAIWTMSPIFLGGKATVSQKSWVPFYRCGREGEGWVQNLGRGVQGVSALGCCLAGSCWRCPFPALGVGAGRGPPQACLYPRPLPPPAPGLVLPLQEG